jgi:hypothetical protein
VFWIRVAARGVLGVVAALLVPAMGVLGMGLAVVAGSAAAALLLAGATLGKPRFRSAG